MTGTLVLSLVAFAASAAAAVTGWLAYSGL